MKATSQILLQCLALIGSVSAQGGFLYPIDITPRSYSPQTLPISPDTAFSILARRLGVSERRRLASIDEAVLEQLDEFGGHQLPLFGDVKTATEPSKLVLAIEGYDKSDAKFRASPQLTISKPSSDLASLTTIRDLLSSDSQREPGLKPTCNYNMMTKEGVKVSFTFRNDHITCPSSSELFAASRQDDDELTLTAAIQFADLSIFSAIGYTMTSAFFKLDFTEMQKRVDTIDETVRKIFPFLLIQAEHEAQESTILLLPTPSKLANSRLQARESPEEAPLSVPSSKPSHATSPLASSSLRTLNNSAPFIPPGTFLPFCFASNDSCLNSTNYCSGHGSCYAKHTGCFSCKCGTTIARYNKDGSFKTVQWGGAACQKKDVSVPFFLFASFGVGMAALIAGSIGMLYSMGAEELPSVIGAGVAGPKAK